VPATPCEWGAHPLVVPEWGAHPLVVLEWGAHPLVVPERGAHPLVVPERGAHPLVVPEGRLKVAQHFSAGLQGTNTNGAQVPEGRMTWEQYTWRRQRRKRGAAMNLQVIK
jgi:hypothetical protein